MCMNYSQIAWLQPWNQNKVNLWHTEFISENTKIYLCFLWFLKTEKSTGSWNLSLRKRRIRWSCIFNAMDADVLDEARASAAIVLTKLSWNIPVSAPKGWEWHALHLVKRCLAENVCKLMAWHCRRCSWQSSGLCTGILTHCGSEMPYGVMELHQSWFR